MLRRLKVCNFKSFKEMEIELPRLAVLFGPNAVGKSNLIDAIQALSQISTNRTLADALRTPIRGYPSEMFRFPPGGLVDLLSVPTAQFSLEADLAIQNRTSTIETNYRYRIAVEIDNQSGKLTNHGEYLSALTKAREPKQKPAIQVDQDNFIIRRQTGGRPRSEERGINYAVLSDQRLSAPAYEHIERVRKELADWRTYYLDPRLRMRIHRSPMDVHSIGTYGQNISPFLYKIKAENPKYFKGIVRTLQTIIPTLESVEVDLNKQQGHLDLSVRQYGTDYSSRVISEGTLRLLGLCSIIVNPWNGSLLAFEEPENGVHPRRIELIAKLIVSLSLEGNQQVIVTTHSPIFCGEILKQARLNPKHDIGLFTFHGNDRATEIRPFSSSNPLYDDTEIMEQLTSKGEDGLFEGLVMRGLIDE